MVFYIHDVVTRPNHHQDDCRFRPPLGRRICHEVFHQERYRSGPPDANEHPQVHQGQSHKSPRWTVVLNAQALATD